MERGESKQKEVDQDSRKKDERKEKGEG